MRSTVDESFVRQFPEPELSAPAVAPFPGRVPVCLQDLAVSRALAINCECLLQVGPPHPDALSVDAERLRADFERLLALWQLVSRQLGRHQAKQSAGRMQDLLDLLPQEPAVAGVAQDILDNAGDGKTRAALRQLMDEWSSLFTRRQLRSQQALSKEAMSRLLQRDSAAWRSAFDAVRVSDECLIESGFLRTYRRARKLSLDSVEKKAGLARLQRWRRRVAQVTGQLELLESDLSESNKECLWHLTRLERVLRKRIALREFSTLLQQIEKGATGNVSKALARTERACRERDKALVRRARKLTNNGFARKPRAFARALTRDSANICL